MPENITSIPAGNSPVTNGSQVIPPAVDSPPSKTQIFRLRSLRPPVLASLP